MGMGQEMLEDARFDAMFKDWWDQQESIWEPSFVPKTWTPEHGGTVLITDMTTNHITNCISWLKRERAGWPYVNRMIAAFEAELARRNENDQLDTSNQGPDPLQPT